METTNSTKIKDGKMKEFKVFKRSKISRDSKTE